MRIHLCQVEAVGFRHLLDVGQCRGIEKIKSLRCRRIHLGQVIALHDRGFGKVVDLFGIHRFEIEALLRGHLGHIALQLRVVHTQRNTGGFIHVGYIEALLLFRQSDLLSVARICGSGVGVGCCVLLGYWQCRAHHCILPCSNRHAAVQQTFGVHLSCCFCRCLLHQWRIGADKPFDAVFYCLLIGYVPLRGSAWRSCTDKPRCCSCRSGCSCWRSCADASGGSWINVVWILLPGCGVYHVCVPLMKKTAHDGLEFCFDTKFYIIADHSCFQSYPGFLEKLSPLGR